VLTNRATHLCKCNGVADLLKHDLHNVLPCRIWSFCVKGCRHREPPKLGSAWTPIPWGGSVADHLKTSPLPICVTTSTSNMVVLRQRVCAEIEGNLKDWGALGLHPLAVGWSMTPQKYTSPALSNLVVIRQTLQALLTRSA